MAKHYISNNSRAI